MKFALRNVVVLVLLSASAGSGFAAKAPTVFNFSDLMRSGNVISGSTLPYLGDGVVCTGGDICSSDVDSKVFGGDLVYKAGTITAAATGFFSATPNSLAKQVAVIQDHVSTAEKNSGGAGLGVYHSKDNGDDNITSGETLKMTFDQVVKLSNIGLRSEGHSSTWPSGTSSKTFEFSTNGTSWDEKTLQGSLNLTAQSNTFYFRFGGAKADQFYLGAMTVAAVPEPETYAMLLAGLGLMGGLARRRRAKQVA